MIEPHEVQYFESCLSSDEMSRKVDKGIYVEIQTEPTRLVLHRMAPEGAEFLSNYDWMGFGFNSNGQKMLNYYWNYD